MARFADLSEETVLRVLRVEEPISIHGLKRWFPNESIGRIDKVLLELLRQKRAHFETGATGEVWYFGAPQTIKILERVTVV